MSARPRRRRRCLLHVPLLTCIAAWAGGCAAPSLSAKRNPSFDVSAAAARRALGEMRAEPKPLRRPLVVLSGFCDPGVAAGHLRSEFRRLTGDDRVIGVSFLFCGDFDACRRSVIAAVDKAFPSHDPVWTTEVDVVGVSMGGLVARYAAAPAAAAAADGAEGEADGPGRRRLRVARLFTISTPHRGASLAALPTFHRLHVDMRAGSGFLRDLADLESRPGGAGYHLYPYVRLGDYIVGEANAAPHGQTPWWVSAEPLQGSHMMAMADARIVADVARRLRGETPFTRDPPEPLPGSKPAPDAHPDAPDDGDDEAPAPAEQESAGSAGHTPPVPTGT